MLNICHGRTPNSPDPEWIIFNDHEGINFYGKSLVDVLLRATKELPKNEGFFINFTKSGANALRNLNP